MAVKTTAPKKRGRPPASSAKKSPSKSAPKRTKEQEHGQKQMWAIVLFALGIFIGAVTMVEGANVWKWLHDTMSGLFGIGSIAIAPVLIYIAVMATLDKPIGTMKHKLWQTFLLVALICAAVQIFGTGIPDVDNFFDGVIELYHQGIEMCGGGLAGAIFGIPLLSMFGKLGAAISIVLLLFVFLMLLTGGTLIGLFHSAVTPVKKLEEAYVDQVEKRNSAKFNIDIPLDNDMPMPRGKAVSEPVEPVVFDRKPELARERLLGDLSSPIDIPLDEPLKLKSERKSKKSELFEPPELPDNLPISPVTSPTKPAGKQSDTLADIELLVNKVVVESESGRFKFKDFDTSEMEPVSSPNAPTPLTEAEKVLEMPKPTVVRQPEYITPSLSLLRAPKAQAGNDITDELKANAQLLVDTLKSFGVQTRIIDISRGPTVTRYELQPSAGVKISRITGLADDIALNLAAAGVRIEAPIPNKAAVGIEVPNKEVSTVTIREIIESDTFQNAGSRLTVALGRDVAGNTAVADVSKMPHMLIAGSTGSGKSVCINSFIVSLLYKASPDEVKFLMIDPKVVELGVYNGIPHLLVPVVTDPRKAAGALGWAVSEMLKRYKTFADEGVRDLHGYNKLAAKRDDLLFMPQIVIIIDELADLMMAAPNEVEDSICRLAQMARAAGMHLVIATQRPSVDVITGIIKANIPSRVAFAVSSQVDSRTILDMGGAEKLLGRGDMLFYPVGSAKPVRIQGCFVTDHEVENIVSFIKEGEKSDYDQTIVEEIEKHAIAEKKSSSSDPSSSSDDDDEMLPAAIECVVEAGSASTSLLQRRLKLGYARAARIVDELEMRGIVGPFEGSKPRQVLISKERWLEMKLGNHE